MLIAEKVIGNPIYDARSGNLVGSLKDVYLDTDLQQISGLFVGSEGLFKKSMRFIPRSAIRAIGEDSILVAAVPEVGDVPESWIRRDTLSGRRIDTSGGTKIGRVGDVIIDKRAKVAGFTLGWLFVTGPLAERHAFGRSAVIDTGNDSDHMSIDLSRAESQNIAVESHLFQTNKITTETNGTSSTYKTLDVEQGDEQLVYMRDESSLQEPNLEVDEQPA